MRRASLLIGLGLLALSSPVLAQTDITNQMPRIEHGQMVNPLPPPQPPPQPQIPTSVQVGPNTSVRPAMVNPPQTGPQAPPPAPGVQVNHNFP